MNCLSLNLLDIFTGLKKVKICTAYMLITTTTRTVKAQQPRGNVHNTEPQVQTQERHYTGENFGGVPITRS